MFLFMASNGGLSVNAVVLTILAVAIGVVLIGSLLAPIADGVMTQLEGLGENGATWANLVGVTVMISILGLVILAINSYTSKR